MDLGPPVSLPPGASYSRFCFAGTARAIEDTRNPRNPRAQSGTGTKSCRQCPGCRWRPPCFSQRRHSGTGGIWGQASNYPGPGRNATAPTPLSGSPKVLDACPGSPLLFHACPSSRVRAFRVGATLATRCLGSSNGPSISAPTTRLAPDSSTRRTAGFQRLADASKAGYGTRRRASRRLAWPFPSATSAVLQANSLTQKQLIRMIMIRI